MSEHAGRPRGRRLQAQVMRVANVPMRVILGLPFRTPLSNRLMMVYLTGRKTGKSYRIPLSQVRHEGALLTPGGGNWTRNLADGQPVRIRLGGRDVVARPELVADPDQIQALLHVMAEANPAMTRFVRLDRDPTGKFDPEQLAAAVRYGFRIVRWHLDDQSVIGLPEPARQR